jgi:hypothetical protein
MTWWGIYSVCLKKNVKILKLIQLQMMIAQTLHYHAACIFILGVSKDFQIVEELLAPVPTERKTGADDFSELVTPFCKYKLP